MREDLVIRASSLPMYADCPRRWAARMANDQFGGRITGIASNAGFAFRTLPPNVGAVTGTATHAGASFINQAHMDTGELPTGHDDEDCALEELDKVLAEGCMWDDTTPQRDTAQKQVRRQVAAYRKYIAPIIQPVAVEERMEAMIREGVKLTGQMDVAEGDVIRDLKTGVMARANGAQYGSYSLLRRSQGHVVNGVVEDFVKRGRMTKSQVEPQIIPHRVDIAERSAWEVIKRIERDVADFENTGEPWAFLANPSSMLCSEKYCPAWGTSFCKQYKGA